MPIHNAAAQIALQQQSSTDTRKFLKVITGEGMAATVILQLLAGPFQTGYLLHLGATSSQIGLVLAITTFVNVLQIIAAIWMQTSMKSRRLWTTVFVFIHRTLWACCGLIPFVFPADWWVPSYIIIYTLAFTGNAFAANIWTSLVGDIVPGSVRGRFFGVRNTIIGGWAIMVVFAGGQILRWFPGEQGYSILFAICGFFALLNTSLFIFYPNPAFIKPANPALLSMLKKPFQDKSFMRAILFLSIWLFIQGIAVPLYSYVMLKVLGIAVDAVSIFTVAQMGITMIAFYFWGSLNARYSTRVVLFWTLPFLALSSFSWVGLSVLPVYLVLVIAHLLLGIGLGGYNQLVFNFIIGDTPQDARPMFIAIYSALTGFAAFMGPLVGGRIYAWIEDAPLWVQSYGIAAAVGAVLLLLAFTYGRRIFIANNQLGA